MAGFVTAMRDDVEVGRQHRRSTGGQLNLLECRADFSAGCCAADAGRRRRRTAPPGRPDTARKAIECLIPITVPSPRCASTREWLPPCKSRTAALRGRRRRRGRQSPCGPPRDVTIFGAARVRCRSSVRPSARPTSRGLAYRAGFGAPARSVPLLRPARFARHQSASPPG